MPFSFSFCFPGDHLKITSTSNSVTAWWLGTLRASYPQDQLGGTGNSIKMHPAAGVTLKLNREDGTLRIKGKHHWEWFKQNFEQVLERGSNEMAGIAELTLELDKLLGFDEGQTVFNIHIVIYPHSIGATYKLLQCR